MRIPIKKGNETDLLDNINKSPGYENRKVELNKLINDLPSSRREYQPSIAGAST